MSKNKHMPEHKRLVTACALPKKKAEKKKKKSRMDKANSYARSKTKNPRSKIDRFRSGKIVFVPGTKTILCEIEKSAGFYLRG